MTTQQNEIKLLKYRSFYFLLSALVIIPGSISLLLNGFRPAIDFTGGTLLEIEFTRPPILNEQEMAMAIPNDFEVASIQKSGDTSYVIRSKPMTNTQSQQLEAAVASKAAALESSTEASGGALATSSARLRELRFETVGPTLGRELIVKTLVAIVLATSSILIYVAYRFKDFKYGLCAIAAMLHDSLILLGTFSLLGYLYGVEIDTLFVTAVLTTLSFSVHDTIVVYDRIRELKEKHKKVAPIDLYNKAVLETLTRSINNSMTIIFMLMALWIFGGESIHWFVFALLVGTIAGTYSSPFTAVPLLTVWDSFQARRKKKR